METLKKIVTNQYFPAAAVLTAVILFWAVGLLGGLSLLHNNQPPLATLTWMLFVYGAAVLTPLAGLLAAVDLARRWRRNRAANAEMDNGGAYLSASAQAPETGEAVAATAGDVTYQPTSRPEAQTQPQAAAQPAAAAQPQAPKPAVTNPAAKKPISKKAGSKKAA